MIDFYTTKNPNGSKVQIMLEELGMKYELHWVDPGESPEDHPGYLQISPDGGVPSIVDREGGFGRQIPVFESGAILQYLAEKSHHFEGTTEFEKAQVMSWLMFQMAVLGPNFGNYSYAKNNDIPQMANRFEDESKWILKVMNTQLAQNQYIAGDFYSIADIATYPWVEAYMKIKPEWFEPYPHVLRWAKTIGQRPAVKKVLES